MNQRGPASRKLRRSRRKASAGSRPISRSSLANDRQAWRAAAAGSGWAPRRTRRASEIAERAEAGEPDPHAHVGDGQRAIRQQRLRHVEARADAELVRRGAEQRLELADEMERRDPNVARDLGDRRSAPVTVSVRQHVARAAETLERGARDQHGYSADTSSRITKVPSLSTPSRPPAWSLSWPHSSSQSSWTARVNSARFVSRVPRGIEVVGHHEGQAVCTAVGTTSPRNSAFGAPGPRADQHRLMAGGVARRRDHAHAAARSPSRRRQSGRAPPPRAARCSRAGSWRGCARAGGWRPSTRAPARRGAPA